jgi:hypothetical protein
MSCDDFAAMDDAWEVAFGYWFVNGRPGYLDPDGDGLPCENLPLPAQLVDDPPDQFPAGMLCSELVVAWDRAPFWFVVAYWLAKGEPERMDADRDGVPCETVYPDYLIRHDLEDPFLRPDEPSGMSCQEAWWWRPFYPQLLAYYFGEGFPTRMDEDGDGFPCESFYDDAGSAERFMEDFPPDLTCGDLEAGSMRYQDVITYFLAYGHPAELDPDGDGYPCSPGWPWPDEVEMFKEGSDLCCAG